MTEYIALAETQITGPGEGGVIGNTVFQAQFAEPSIGQVDLNLSASWRSDRMANTYPTINIRIIRTGSIEGRPTSE